MLLKGAEKEVDDDYGKLFLWLSTEHEWDNSVIVPDCVSSCSLRVEQDCMVLSVLILGFPSGMPATERGVLQEQLIDIILEVLKRNPQLHYYQGYHDVAVSLLLVVGERMAIGMLDKLSNFHLRFYIYF